MTTVVLPYGFVAVVTEEAEVPRSESTDTEAHRHVCWSCREGWSHVDENCEGGAEAGCADCETGGPDPWWVSRAPMGFD